MNVCIRDMKVRYLLIDNPLSGPPDSVRDGERAAVRRVLRAPGTVIGEGMGVRYADERSTVWGLIRCRYTQSSVFV